MKIEFYYKDTNKIDNDPDHWYVVDKDGQVWVDIEMSLYQTVDIGWRITNED